MDIRMAINEKKWSHLTQTLVEEERECVVELFTGEWYERLSPSSPHNKSIFPIPASCFCPILQIFLPIPMINISFLTKSSCLLKFELQQFLVFEELIKKDYLIESFHYNLYSIFIELPFIESVTTERSKQWAHLHLQEFSAVDVKGQLAPLKGLRTR